MRCRLLVGSVGNSVDATDSGVFVRGFGYFSLTLSRILREVQGFNSFRLRPQIVDNRVDRDGTVEVSMGQAVPVVWEAA